MRDLANYGCQWLRLPQHPEMHLNRPSWFKSWGACMCVCMRTWCVCVCAGMYLLCASVYMSVHMHMWFVPQCLCTCSVPQCMCMCVWCMSYVPQCVCTCGCMSWVPECMCAWVCGGTDCVTCLGVCGVRVPMSACVCCASASCWTAAAQGRTTRPRAAAQVLSAGLFAPPGAIQGEQRDYCSQSRVPLLSHPCP